MGVGLVLKDLPGKHKSPQRDVVYKVSTVGILSIILILCMYRSHIRTLDWQDTYTFINVTYETSNNSFFKAVRLGMLGKAISVFNPEEKEKINKYFYDTLDLLVEARTETERNKFLYQDKLPGIVKAYGLDYESLIRKITFLEVASRCIELKESHKVGIELLKPYIEENTKVEPSIAELYAYLLMQDKNLKEAKEVLLRSERAFPNDILVLNKLFDISILENNYSKAEEYLKRELKLYSHDSSILLKALRFYSFMKNTELANRYYYLYKLRTGN
jgi:tetratricopeptide (TPR) repeat protein